MVLLEQLGEELLTHIIPQLPHSWKTPMHQWCVLSGKHPCIIPWIFNSSCFNRLEMQGHGIGKVKCVHLWDTAHCSHFIALLFNTTQTPTGKHSPIQRTQLLMQNTGMLGRRTLTLSFPRPFPRNSAVTWEQLTLRGATGEQQLQLTGRFGFKSLAKCFLQPKAAVLQQLSWNSASLTERDNNGEIKRGEKQHTGVSCMKHWDEEKMVSSTLKFPKCRTNLPVTTIKELVDWTFFLVKNLQYFPQLQNLQRTSA